MTELSLLQLSQVALQAGLDVGFNAVEVETWIDADTYEVTMGMCFGDKEQMRRPRRLRTPCEWALSYSEESACIRSPRTLQVPRSLRSKSTAEIRRYIVTELLEVKTEAYAESLR